MGRLLDAMGADGHGFELLTKWFLENEPEYQAMFSSVWLWDDWPHRFGPDRGIDLVAQTHEGLWVAIQAKHYAERYSIKKQDIDSFLSESNRALFSERLLVASTNRLANSARDTMVAQEKPVSTCLRERLEASGLPWPRTPDQLLPVSLPSFAPRDDQQLALEAISRWAETQRPRAQVIRACGTGKTLISIWAADLLDADRVLVLVPTLELLRQTARAWCQHSTRHRNRRRRLLRVCSDERPIEDDLAQGDELSISGTTDTRQIAEALADNQPILVLCTYNSSPLVAEAMTMVSGEFDVAIADEAHRCAGLEGTPHKTILDGRAIRARRRLFFTATPTRFGTRDRGRLRQKNVEVASMDDVTKFGPVIHHLSFADAIERGLLCPYEVAIIPIDDDEVHALIQQRRIVTADGDQHLEAASLATQVACARAMRRFACRRMVAFHATIRHSRRFSEHFPTTLNLMSEQDRPQLPVWSKHVDGAAMAVSQRAQLIARFKADSPAEHRLLSNVRMLSEGVDHPAIDAVAFLHTHRGQAAVIQAVGRAVRPAVGKTLGTIVLPIVMRRDEPFAAALARSEHRHIIDVLNALRSHDPQIIRSLDSLRFHTDEHRPPPATGRFVIDAAFRVDQDFADAVDVALAYTLGATPERARLHRKASPVVISERPAPSAEETFLIGLDQIQAYRPRQLLTRIPEAAHGFPLRTWWEEACRRWHAGELQETDRYTIADNVSWLSPDVRSGSPMQYEMAEITSADVCEQLAAQLLRGGVYEHGQLGALIESEREHDALVDELRALHDVVTHAAMSPRLQLRQMRLALGPLASSLAAGVAGEEPPAWYFMSRCQAAVESFVDVLHPATVPALAPYRRDRHSRHSSLHEAMDQGERAAQRRITWVARIEPFRFAHDRDEVAREREAQLDWKPDDRFDALGWEIYLLVRAIGGSFTLACGQAMDGNYERRRAVRRERLDRALRPATSA